MWFRSILLTSLNSYESKFPSILMFCKRIGIACWATSKCSDELQPCNNACESSFMTLGSIVKRVWLKGSYFHHDNNRAIPRLRFQLLLTSQLQSNANFATAEIFGLSKTSSYLRIQTLSSIESSCISAFSRTDLMSLIIPPFKAWLGILLFSICFMCAPYVVSVSLTSLILMVHHKVHTRQGRSEICPPLPYLSWFVLSLPIFVWCIYFTICWGDKRLLAKASNLVRCSVNLERSNTTCKSSWTFQCRYAR